MVGFHPADPDSNSGTSTFRPPSYAQCMADYCEDIVCHCGFRGKAVPRRQHMECPRCGHVVEACCEGAPVWE